MKHIEYYVADDGTKFANAYECEEYELLQKYNVDNIDKHLKVFDEDKQQIAVGSISNEQWQNNSWWFIIYDIAGFEYLEAARDYTGIELPTRCGDESYPIILEYSDILSTYFNLKEEYEEIKEKYESISKYV